MDFYLCLFKLIPTLEKEHCSPVFSLSKTHVDLCAVFSHHVFLCPKCKSSVLLAKEL